MDTNHNIKKNDTDQSVTDEELAQAFTAETPKMKVSTSGTLATKRGKPALDKLSIIFTVFGVGFSGGGIAMLLFALLVPPEAPNQIEYPNLTEITDTDTVYSDLTGERLADVSLKNAPAYCIQTPNGTDGARPHAGLDQAGVVFEAIAEAGITRFAAIYQNPTASIIGPIRSLRIYYLEWDTPFDCAIVHAGGADDALAAVSHGYKDLTEDYNYMFRGTNGARLWNNLFTSASSLKQFSDNHGYTTSNIKGFARMTPTESEKSRIDQLAVERLVITKPAQNDTSSLNPVVSNISFKMGGWSDFNVNYQYDVASNKYLRGYESGVAHQVYSCPDGAASSRNPEDFCSMSQMTPSVVIAMVVAERRAWDGYHEDIDTIGTGEAYVFQNGTAIHGTWRKGSREEQIQFTDDNGQEIRLAPGQTFITAVPQYGTIAF